MPSAKLKFGVFSGVCYVSFFSFFFSFFSFFFKLNTPINSPTLYTSVSVFIFTRETKRSRWTTQVIIPPPPPCDRFMQSVRCSWYDIVSGLVLPGRHCLRSTSGTTVQLLDPLTATGISIASGFHESGRSTVEVRA